MNQHHHTFRWHTAATLALMLVLLMSACKTTKNTPSATQGNSQQTVAPVSETPRDLSVRYVHLTKSYTPWHDARIPVTLNLKRPVDISIGGSAIMVRDEYVYLSFRYLGMEMLRVTVTNDSVFAVYKIKKFYIAESLNNLVGKMPITVANLQDMLTGRAFVAGAETLPPLSPNTLSLLGGTDRSFTITPKAKGPYAYSFSLNSANQVTALTVAPEGYEPVNIVYGSDAKTSVGELASSTSANVKIGKVEIDATLDWNLDKAKFDSGADVKWIIPKGYKRVKAEELLGNFSL